MKKRHSQLLNKILTGLTITAFVMVAAVSRAQDTTELDQVRALFAEGKVLHANMIHEFQDSYTGEMEITEGEIWISKTMYKVRSEHQVVVVDGILSRVYNEQQNKLVISEYEPEEDDFAPSRFFSEDEELYRIRETERGDDTVTFHLYSDDPFEYILNVTIVLDHQLIPLEILAVDQMENEIRTVFMDAEYIDDPETLFELDYPEDAEIIDLRN